MLRPPDPVTPGLLDLLTAAVVVDPTTPQAGPAATNGGVVLGMPRSTPRLWVEVEAGHKQPPQSALDAPEASAGRG